MIAFPSTKTGFKAQVSKIASLSSDVLDEEDDTTEHSDVATDGAGEGERWVLLCRLVDADDLTLEDLGECLLEGEEVGEDVFFEGDRVLA